MAPNSGEYWYNLETGEVEHGPVSPAVDRAGPFATAEEAARAPEILRQRSQDWDEDERREADWPEQTGHDGTERQ